MLSTFWKLRSGMILFLLPLTLWSLCAAQATAPASAPATAPASAPAAAVAAVPATAPAPAPTVLSATVPVAASTSAPASVPASLPTDRNAEQLRAKAIDDVLSGRVDQGIGEINEAYRLLPADENLARAVETLKQYSQIRGEAQAHRQSEYNQAIQRVKRSQLVQKILPDAATKNIITPLHKMVKELTGIYNKIPLNYNLDNASDEEAAEMKTTAVESIDKMAAILQDALGLVKGYDSPYSQVLKEVVNGLSQRLTQNKEIWKGVNPKDQKARHLASLKLLDIEDLLLDSMADLETMSSEEPWRIGLAYARLAKTLATDAEKMLQEPWCKALIADAETRARDAVKNAKWYDALSLYSDLDELQEDSEPYKEMVKVVRQHVRMLRLYGEPEAASQPAAGNNKKGAASKPATDDDDLDWRQMTEGIDAAMVRSAITKLNELYVTKPDYRKIARGGLMSVKILAETPQAAYSFPKLKDKDLKEEFVASINRLLDNIDAKENVDSLDLQYALNSMLRASDRTVEIPVGVLAMEFTDGFLGEMDKFSAMIWPSELKDFEKQTMGTFVGIGVQVEKDENEPLRVATPLPDSPAYKAGMKVGDIILTVDGQKTQDLSIDKLINMIMGEPGTSVALTVKRRGIPEPLTMSIVREKISIRTVKGWKYLPSGEYDYMLDPKDKIAYIRVSQFTEQTHSELDAVLEELHKKNVRSLILDLRYNPGGLLRSASQVSDEFLSSGRIVSTHGIQQPQTTELNAEPGGNYVKGDLVVLVNDRSASAAEIVSGALKDWRRAIIVGDRSYGKGSVQNVIQIPRHRAYLKLTTAYYYLPSGRCLHRRNGDKVWGVDPDLSVPMTSKQTRRWLELRRRTDLLYDEGQPNEQDEDLARQYKSDIQLETAVMAAKMMRLQNRPAQAAVASSN